MNDEVVSFDEVKGIVNIVLAEDIGKGDITSKISLPKHTTLKVSMIARERLIVCGVPIVLEILKRLVPDAILSIHKEDGSEVLEGHSIISVEGKAEGILTAERCALNLIQFLSGIATLTREFVTALNGTKVQLLDTRKTIPGLRLLSKYAVKCGGGTNHRMRLDDGILIKDNHIFAAGGIYSAVKMAKLGNSSGFPIQAECDSLEQVKQALEAGADSLLLDNMSVENLKQAVEIVGGRIPLEASGGITKKTIRTIALTGIDYISVGAITQKAPAVDIGMDTI